MNAVLERLCRREDLAPIDLEALFARLVAGELDPLLLAALLVALKLKGETGAEIAAAARALRTAARPFPRPDYFFADTCGTGGDGKGTLNVSSGVAFCAAACGLPVAKHGNRSVSSRSGSADVLEALGVNLRADAVTARRCLDEAGLCFLFAPDYHPGIAHAMP
ncbi:MAG: anthranilate phosphoribosyltransferase, partial [Gammaproteobacteria bacterium]